MEVGVVQKRKEKKNCVCKPCNVLYLFIMKCDIFKIPQVLKNTSFYL